MHSERPSMIMLQDLELSNTVTPNPGNEALQIPIVTAVPEASYSVPFSFQQHNATATAIVGGFLLVLPCPWMQAVSERVYFYPCTDGPLDPSTPTVVVNVDHGDHIVLISHRRGSIATCNQSCRDRRERREWLARFWLPVALVGHGRWL